jgi:hypothetical protein
MRHNPILPINFNDDFRNFLHIGSERWNHHGCGHQARGEQSCQFSHSLSTSFLLDQFHNDFAGLSCDTSILQNSRWNSTGKIAKKFLKILALHFSNSKSATNFFVNIL